MPVNRLDEYAYMYVYIYIYVVTYSLINLGTVRYTETNMHTDR